MSAESFQLMPALDAATEAALRSSIERFGVLVPVVRDQHGRTIDGHHRSRIADELGVAYPTDTVHVDDDEQAREIARTLNADRRHLTIEQRREVVADLREQGHSLRAIAGVVGASHEQVRKDAAAVNHLTPADRVVGRDGKSYPATVQNRTPVEVEPPQEAAPPMRPVQNWTPAPGGEASPPADAPTNGWDAVESVRETIEAKYAPQRAVRDAMSGLTRAIQKLVDADPNAAEYIARLDVRERASFAKDCGHELHFIESAVRILGEWREASSQPSKLEAVK